METSTLELTIVSPDQARHWLDNNNFERQRKIAPWHVAGLAREMLKGRFVEGTQIMFAECDGVRHLVDGQHTLSAICKAKIPVLLGIMVAKVASIDDVGLIYGRLGRNRRRTPADAYFAIGMANKLGLSNPEINTLGAAVRYVANGFQRPVVGNTNDATAELATSVEATSDAMFAWAEEAGLFFEHARRAQHGLKDCYMRAPVVAVALPTFRHQLDKAQDFWGVAVANDGLSNRDPRNLLNTYLLSHSSGRADPLGYMRVVAAAWNAFFAGRRLNFLKPSDVGKVGLTVAGTPYEAVVRTGRRYVGTVPSLEAMRPLSPADHASGVM